MIRADRQDVRLFGSVLVLHGQLFSFGEMMGEWVKEDILGEML